MKLRAIKTWWDDKENKWITVGTVFDPDFAEPYIDAGLAIPLRKRRIETAIRKAPEQQVTR